MTTASQALADVCASLVAEHDIAGTLAALLTGCAASLDAVSAGIQVDDGSGRLELLASSSHEDGHIALYESQETEGPASEAASSGRIIESHADETSRWPRLAGHMTDAGVRGAVAAPMRWIDTPLGVLTIFRATDVPLTTREQRTAQSFADVAVLTIIHTDVVSVRSAVQRAQEALTSRIVVEQAKGVLAQRHGLTMAEAFDELRRRAHVRGTTLTVAARDAVEKVA